MPYRPKRSRARRSGSRSSNVVHPRGSYAARIAIARHKARKPGSTGPSALIAVALVAIISFITVASASVIAAGGAAGITIATLDQDLPDVRAFQDLGFSQPSRVYDRKGKVELARFGEKRRTVLEFEQIPELVLDVTTAVEDDTFWDNPGFDLQATVNAFVTEAGGGGDRGGGSTITQQLVRARLLPAELIANDNTRDGLYLRKAKELIQSFKLTQAFPGEAGKEAIITAYLNEIPYGERSFGIAAAARTYLGKSLKDLTVAEAALLAGIPKAPTTNNLFRHAKTEKYGNKKKQKNGKRRRATRLVVPHTCVGAAPTCTLSEPVIRRNFILKRLRDGNGRWTSLSEAEYQAALAEPIILDRPQARNWKAPHFVAAMRAELDAILADREPFADGGYRVTTTLDWRAQTLGERYVKAGAHIPNLGGSAFSSAVNRNKLRSEVGWMSRLRGANIRNGAMVAQDYRTGDVLAYVGSAGYYRSRSCKSRRIDCKFEPRYDHAGQGFRQPGSAWKPMVYATGIDTGAITAGSVVLDITTPFGPGWQPKDADRLERGPILIREALQYSLNIPAIRALHKTGVKEVRKYVTKAGLEFIGGDPKFFDRAGLAGAIGTVEIRVVDLVAAYGAFGNGGKVTRPRYILKVEDANGEVIYKAGDPVTTQVWSPEAAYIMSDILKGNTNPGENSIWGPRFQINNVPGGQRRVAALKTGTTNDLRDYSTYGLLPQPKNKKKPALAVGFWFGNSDHSSPTVPSSRPIYSSDNAGEAWQGFVRDYTRGLPNADFKRPKRVVTATIDRFSGGAPGPWTRSQTTEIFIQGTQPGGNRQVDPPGLIYSRGCGTYYVQPARAENAGAPASWLAAVNAWAAKGGRGTSRWGTRGTTFGMAGKTSFGGAVAPGTDCQAPRSTGENKKDDKDTSAGGGGGGGGNNGPAPAPTCRPGSTTKPNGCVIPSPG